MLSEPWKSPDWLEPDWTDRQVEVLRLIARGRTNPEIGEDLGVSFAGAKWHVSEVLSRLGVLSRLDAAAYWRWRTSRRVRVKQLMRGFVAVGIGKMAAGGAAAALTGAAIVVGVLWSLDGESTDPKVISGADESAVPTPTPETAVETASIDINETQQLEVPNLFGADGPQVGGMLTGPESDGQHLITLDRIGETERSTIACVEFGGLFVSTAHRGLTTGTPSLVTVNGEVVRGIDLGKSSHCRSTAYEFDSVSGTTVDGGWIVFPYAAAFASYSIGFTGGPDVIPPPDYVAWVTKFEWLNPPIDLDLDARAIDFQPEMWVADSPYYGTSNRAILGSYESWDGTWEVSAFRYRGVVCLMLYHPFEGHDVSCNTDGETISLWSRSVHQPIQVRSVQAFTSQTRPEVSVPEGANVFVDKVFVLPGDFGVEMSFDAILFTYEEDLASCVRARPPDICLPPE